MSNKGNNTSRPAARQRKRRPTFSNIFDNEHQTGAGTGTNEYARYTDQHKSSIAVVNNNSTDTDDMPLGNVLNQDSSTALNNYGIIDQRLFSKGKQSRRRKKTSKGQADVEAANSTADNINKNTKSGQNLLIKQNLQKHGYHHANKSDDGYIDMVAANRGSHSAYADNWIRNHPSPLALKQNESHTAPAFSEDSNSVVSPTGQFPPLYNPYANAIDNANPTGYNSFSFRSKRSISVSGGSPVNYDYFTLSKSHDNLEDLFDSDYEFGGSQPSTKNVNSDTSSIDDVCLPIEQSDSEEGDMKTWPDLRVLQEFYDQEMAELNMIAENNSKQAHNLMYPASPRGGTPAAAATAAAARRHDDDAESSTSPAMVGFQSPIISKVDVANEVQPLLTHRRVNEAEGLNGRLRPPRILPWDKSQLGSHVLLGNAEGTNANGRLTEQFRFAYFREDLDTTIHSPTISGILQPGQTFADLFVSSHYSKNKPKQAHNASSVLMNATDDTVALKTETKLTSESRGSTPVAAHMADSSRLDETKLSDIGNSVFWLDVLNPTEEEMKVISKAFGIHPLTTEDIFLGESREKVELFNDYYFICFRSFDIVHEKMKIKAKNELNNTIDEDLEFLKTYHKSFFGKLQCLAQRSLQKLNGSFGKKTAARYPAANARDSASMIRKKQFKSSKNNELQPLNIYIIVFREGILTFHFTPTPHPVNVRRRCRLLQDYLKVSTDWIAYALIDDITDAFGPMIELVEVEVGAIEDEIIRMQSGDSSSDEESDYEERVSIYTKRPKFRKSGSNLHSRFFNHLEGNSDKRSVHTTDSVSSMSSTSTSSTSSTIQWQRKGDMLRRIGESRKKVMSLLRLLGSKADVIKGFSKKCSENFDVSPRSEIGMYLGDIQDHIITMVQTLNHCEKLLARSHSNYLAQINIDMTKVNNDMNDVLGKITILGTIVLPMNVITGLWGMNVIVPGQEYQGLAWFMSITGCMFLFALVLYVVARHIGVA